MSITFASALSCLGQSHRDTLDYLRDPSRSQRQTLFQILVPSRPRTGLLTLTRALCRSADVIILIAPHCKLPVPRALCFQCYLVPSLIPGAGGKQSMMSWSRPREPSPGSSLGPSPPSPAFADVPVIAGDQPRWGIYILEISTRCTPTVSPSTVSDTRCPLCVLQTFPSNLLLFP